MQLTTGTWLILILALASLGACATLGIQGVVYTISLEGFELVKGVGKGFAPIEGYSEGDIALTASANLLTGLRFISSMMREPGEQLDYEFKARLDLGGIHPSIRVSETGQLSFGAASPR